MRISLWTALVGLTGAVLGIGCSDNGPAEVPSARPAASRPDVDQAWSEEEVSFEHRGETLFGILTSPTDDGPHPAVVLISGSGDESGARAGTDARTFVEHARGLATEGYAVLRYDPPGVGRSTGRPGLPSLAERTDETLAALTFLSSQGGIIDDAVGLQGWSQGPWVMAMTAAEHPEQVAFLVSVVGSGSSVAEQQIHGIEAQTRAAGHDDTDVAKAVLLGRLLIDWQLLEPIYRDVNEADVAHHDDDRLRAYAELVYGDRSDPVDDLRAGIDILTSLQHEPWAAALYLEELYLPRLRAIPPDVTAEQLDAIKAVNTENLTTDPADFLSKVTVPVIAIFGEDDLNVDSERSARLYREYLRAAGNDDVTIVVLPDVGHNIGRHTPGYWSTLTAWLGDHRTAWAPSD
jgi:pimeloyl-ACP methyl ester carboxylesterase